MAERSFRKEVSRCGSARVRNSAARGSSRSPRPCCSPAWRTSAATRARRSRTSWMCSRTREDILNELGVHFEASASEATAAAMLAASINYPLRGAVTWKSTVGTNVASDALVESRIGRSQGRGAHHPRRGLRRGREHHAGAHARVRDEVADVAARSAPASARYRARGRARLRAVRSQQHAGHADAAHPRLPRVRPLRRARTTAGRRSRRPMRWRSRRATTAASSCRRRPTRRSGRRSSSACRPRSASSPSAA